MNYDVFISYHTKSAINIATAICNELESKKIKTTTYKMLKENKNTYLPLITYQDGTIFVGYKKIQP